MTPHQRARRRAQRPLWAASIVALTTAGALGVSAPAIANPAAPGPAPTANPAQPGLPSTPAGAPPAADTTPAGKDTAGAQAASIKAALEHAAKTGRNAPIGALTDEYSTTSARPNGSLTTIYSSSPDRVRQQGRWVPVDTTLVRHADGSYGPKASLTPVSFGGGGSNALVTLHNGDHALNFTWTLSAGERCSRPARR